MLNSPANEVKISLASSITALLTEHIRFWPTKAQTHVYMIMIQISGGGVEQLEFKGQQGKIKPVP